MRLEKIYILLIAFVGGIAGYNLGYKVAENDFLTIESSLLDKIYGLEGEIENIYEEKEKIIEEEFIRQSDSAYTPTKKIKYKKAQKAKTKVDSLEFVVEKKIEMIRLKKWNDSVEEHLLRTEIQRLKKD
jgi:hypothetical protein